MLAGFFVPATIKLLSVMYNDVRWVVLSHLIILHEDLDFSLCKKSTQMRLNALRVYSGRKVFFVGEEN